MYWEMLELYPSAAVVKMMTHHGKEWANSSFRCHDHRDQKTELNLSALYLTLVG